MSCPFGWDYNTTGFETVITQQNWVCEDAWRGPLTQSIFFIGSMFGLVVFGWISDNYGRCVTFYATNVLVVATGVSIPYCTNFYLFLVVRFLMGMCLNSFYSSIFVLGNFLIVS